MPDRICSVPECEKPRGYGRSAHCEMHYYRIRRNGDPTVITDTRLPVVKYRAAHARLTRDRGRACDQRCIDCGTEARHWSYDHADPNELISDDGQAFSLDVMRYEPRCYPCHARFDGTGANQYGPSPVRAT